MKKIALELNGPANLWLLLDLLEKKEITQEEFLDQARLNIKATKIYMLASVEAAANNQKIPFWYTVRERAQLGLSNGEKFLEETTLPLDFLNHISSKE